LYHYLYLKAMPDLAGIEAKIVLYEPDTHSHHYLSLWKPENAHSS
jgi:hypothetical protein